MKSAKCPQCGAAMEEGFLVDRAHGNTFALPQWAAGEPQRSFFGGLKMRGRRRYQVLTRRCTRCGLLESLARDPVE